MVTHLLTYRPRALRDPPGLTSCRFVWNPDDGGISLHGRQTEEHGANRRRGATVDVKTGWQEDVCLIAGGLQSDHWPAPGDVLRLEGDGLHPHPAVRLVAPSRTAFRRLARQWLACNREYNRIYCAQTHARHIGSILQGYVDAVPIPLPADWDSAAWFDAFVARYHAYRRPPASALPKG